MTLTDFINRIVDLDELQFIGETKTLEETKMKWQENYKVYVTFRHQTYDKAYSLLKYIRNTFRRFDILPSFSYYEEYKSNYLDNDELLSGLWILVLVYRTVNDLDLRKLKQCGVVKNVEVIDASSGAKKMYVIKIEYYNDVYNIEIETEGDEEDEGDE